MANMYYCRFENTYQDLLDCYENIDLNSLSETEKHYRKRLIDLCFDIARDYCSEDQVKEFIETNN